MRQLPDPEEIYRVLPGVCLLHHKLPGHQKRAPQHEFFSSIHRQTVQSYYPIGYKTLFLMILVGI